MSLSLGSLSCPIGLYFCFSASTTLRTDTLYLVFFMSVTQLCLTLCDSIDCSTPGLPVHHQLPELAQTHVHRVGDAIQPSHSLFSPSPPAFNLSQHQGLFQWVISSHHQLSFSISSSNECSGLISFSIDWFDLLSVQGTLKSICQYHSSKAKILQHSVFFMVQLSDPYMTTGRTIAMNRWTFVGKIMSLLFNMLSRYMSFMYLVRNLYINMILDQFFTCRAMKRYLAVTWLKHGVSQVQCSFKNTCCWSYIYFVNNISLYRILSFSTFHPCQ